MRRGCGGEQLGATAGNARGIPGREHLDNKQEDIIPNLKLPLGGRPRRQHLQD